MKKLKKPLKQLPSQQLLQEVQDFILTRPNHKSERKRWIHCGLFFLCLKSGLRVSEAINFDLEMKNPKPECQDLYLVRGKGRKDRYIYVDPKVIEVLKMHNWEPNKTTRRDFWEFLSRVRYDLKISASIEFAPHTLRRCFATYNVGSIPLDVLQKILGHSRVSTTDLYVRDSDIARLLKYKPI
ncbi:MAG: tyrosine-type recombinase/integrase [Candidatus Moeniiplasma glomeromycotorum]|nr:tyrosine-type recombinase/integrase [Candidatus Moeniiplasma glomeromycotorum]MCE8167415.1 tyrosine-type recombinase/integrase [Candidatus Moeniiplasma glomeromycotorum]MCE8168571.1 tyrosine-type recombinase/integrase [Candidatus Moeniiplasma glomeromycotorum]